MRDDVLEAQIAAATAYEELHVPALFRQFAGRVLDAVPVEQGDRVLDVACGTGVLAREAAERVGVDGRVAGIDPGPGMLAVAGRQAPAVEWRQGTAEALPYPDRSFDAVVSQFGLMFFTDRPRAVREMVRVLKPGGRLVVVVWDALENSPAYLAAVSLLERLAGRPAADALRAPFVLGDPEGLTALFESVGVASPVVTTHSGTARFPGIRAMVEAELRGWLPVMGVLLGEHQIGAILEEAESALRPFVADDGRMVFDAPALIVTGTKP